MKQIIIRGSSIPEVWFRTIKACVQHGHIYTIDKGEYEGQQRKEFDIVNVHIEKPGIRPLACQSQTITPTSDEKIEKYFQDYLMNPEISEEERKKSEYPLEYKYATWIAAGWKHCCDLLMEGQGGCNQATISLGSIADENQHFTHPPCLRLVDMRLRYGALHFILYFRSWDLVAGYPENLGGLQLLKEWCLEYINSHLPPEKHWADGSITAISKGLHIYDHFWKIAEEYAGDTPCDENMGVHVI